jgi:hypothetical protein
MAMQVEEAYNGSRLTKGQNPSGEIRYIVFGVDDTSGGFSEADVIAEVADESPANFDGIPRTDISTQAIAAGVWEATVTYGRRDSRRRSVDNQAYSWSFNTGGQTENVQLAIAQTATSLIAGLAAADFGVNINVDQDGNPQGVDIVAPKLEFSETHIIPRNTVEQSSGAWVKDLAGITGSVNNATFRSFSAGEVLMLGASGQKRDDGDYDVTFQFLCSPNVSLTFPIYSQDGTPSGNNATIAKGGHEYLWFQSAQRTDATALETIVRARSVYKSQVYPAANFGSVIP